MVKVITKSRFEDILFWSMGTYLFGPPSWYVRSYLIDGLLIDTGQPRIKKQFLKELEHHQIDKIIVTHHHEDHSGNIEAIKKAKRINAYGSERCATILKNPPKVSPAQWISWGQNKAADIIPLDLNKPIVTGKYSFEVIHTPGHAEDQISLYEPNKKWLFPGDLYVNDFILIFMDNEKIEEQISSIQKLLTLDFDVLFCAHNPQFRNGKKYLLAKLKFLEHYYKKVKTEYDLGKKSKQIMKALEIKEITQVKKLSLGKLSAENMVQSVINAERRLKTD